MRASAAALAFALIAHPVPDTANPLQAVAPAATRSGPAQRGTTVPDTAPKTVPTTVPDTASKTVPATVPDTAPTRPPRGDHAKTRAGDREGDGSLEARRKAIATEIVRIGASLRRSIEAGSVEPILARVPSTGLRCGDRIVPRARVERDLRTRGSWLHEVMFGDAGPSPRAPHSLRAFLKAVPDTAIVVGFRRDPTAGPVGRPCLDYRAEGFITPGSPLCFDRRNGAWWLIDSLYPCG